LINKETKKTETELKEIALNVKVERIVGENANGKYDFLAYNTFDKQGKKWKVSFRKEVKNMPQKEGQFTLIVRNDKMSFDRSNKYRKMYIHEIIAVEEFKLKPLADEDNPFI